MFTSDICAKGTRTDLYFLVKITEILLRKQTVTYVFDLFYLPLGFVFSSHVLNGIWRSLRRAICHVRDVADRMETPLLPKWTNKYLTVLWNVNMFHFPQLCYGWRYLKNCISFMTSTTRSSAVLRVVCHAARCSDARVCCYNYYYESIIQNKIATRRVSFLFMINKRLQWVKRL